ncbi:MAG: tetratricopeptide repeat protein [Alistipes sp.]|nr:tetratricopeptide repeat protein [Alistipes sp.]
MIRAKKHIIYIALIIVSLLAGATPLSAQLLPERGLVREGNEQFKRRNFFNSLNRYNEALEHAPESYEAQYNRANAYLHLMLENSGSEEYTPESSNKIFEDILTNQYLSTEQRAEVLRNIGESLFLQQNYEAALNAFRESLKLNPDDSETKRNYVLTKRIVDQKRQAQQQQQQQQQQQDDQQQNDQQQDQQQNQDQPQNDQQQDQNSDNQEDDNQGDNQEENQPEEQPSDEEEQESEAPEPKPEGLDAEQERMLDAIQAEEDRTEEEMREAERGAVVIGKKNW